MKISLTLLCIFVVITFAEDSTLDDGVIVLNGDNFSSTINQFKYAMVLFYTPEQLSSSSLAAEYPAAAKRVSEELPGIKLCKIDCSQNEDYAKTFGSSNGELVIKFFKIGDIEPINYDGGFRADNIGEWLLNKIDDLIPGVSSLEDAQHFISEHKNVGFYFESKDIGKFHEFLGFTTNISDVDFIKTDSEDLMKKFEAWDDSFILFRNHGEEHNTLKGESTSENLNKFIKVYKEPALMQLTPGAASKINSELMDFVLLIHDNSEEGLEKQKSFNEVAKKHRGKIFFFVGQPGEEHVDKFMAKFDFTTANLPVVGILHTSDEHKKYRFDRQINEKNLNIFLANFFEGNLAHYQRSSRQPGRVYDGSVMVSVEGDYNSIVLDNTKDVMIEWYSPWCGHCIHFAPTYSELAEKLKNVPDLIIAKIDATANRVEGVSIFGYPTVKFYPRNNKEHPIDYMEERTVEKIIDFIKAHGTVQINL